MAFLTLAPPGYALVHVTSPHKTATLSLFGVWGFQMPKCMDLLSMGPSIIRIPISRFSDVRSAGPAMEPSTLSGFFSFKNLDCCHVSSYDGRFLLLRDFGVSDVEMLRLLILGTPEMPNYEIPMDSSFSGLFPSP
jgi:hypothetical protein